MMDGLANFKLKNKKKVFRGSEYFGY